ncbi:Quinolinate synthase A [bioreactor metagenome]|uniref:Quinolinate synthase A n=1 Tax=bioreactor metagenome TaxID=1076179 RepID=A0A644YFR0_9ZZZZ
MHELHKKNPKKTFYLVNENQYCSGMKLNTLQKVYNILVSLENEIILDEDLRQKAQVSLSRMHEIAN